MYSKLLYADVWKLYRDRVINLVTQTKTENYLKNRSINFWKCRMTRTYGIVDAMDSRGSMGWMVSGIWDNTLDWVPSVYLLFGEWKYQRSSRMHKAGPLVCSHVHVAVYIFYNSPGLLYLNPGALSRCVLRFCVQRRHESPGNPLSR